MESGLRGRVVLITGASQGMGLATAHAFAAEGARLAICARNKKTLDEAAEEIRKRHKAEVLATPCDVSRAGDVARLAAQVAEHYGQIEVCVANAAGPPAKNFLSITAEEWQQALEMNFLSVVHLARAVVPHMQRRRWGRIITITSVSVKQPIPDLVLSNAVRAAVVGLVKSLANEFGKDGILVNNVAPGYTSTERLTELAATRALAAGVSQKDIYDRWAADTPVRRIGRPEEIADAIVWLASDRASYITGQTILVDGGIYKGL